MNIDVFYTIQSLGWIALAILVPIAVYRRLTLLARKAQRHPWGARIAAGVMTLATAAIFSPLALAYGICAAPPPGESDEARHFKTELSQTVVALDHYRAVNGSYPKTLEDLVPTFLKPSELPREGIQPDYPLAYTHTSSSYTLEFRYTGPGMNYCRYTPEAHWQCGGYF